MLIRIRGSAEGDKTMDYDDYEKYEQQFEARNETLRQVIDALADYEPAQMDEHGFKTELAEEYGFDSQKIHYVLNNWEELVKWRRHAKRNPLDKDLSENAYEDETMQEMASQEQMAADGMGDVKINVELSLSQVFRCMKLLPSDLGTRFFTEAMEQADQVPKQKLYSVLNGE